MVFVGRKGVCRVLGGGRKGVCRDWVVGRGFVGY